MEKLIDILLSFYGPTPYLIIFGILLACGFGLPIPEDVTLFAAGVAAYYGVVSLPGIIVVAYLGVMLGDSAMYFLGAKYGRKLTRRWLFARLLPEDRLNEVGMRLRKRGNSLIFLARFMPGLRAPIFFSAGTLHLPYRIFCFYDGVAALISVPTIIGAIYYFGDELDRVIHVIQKIEHGILFAILGLVIVVLGRWWLKHLRHRRNA